jgi:succinyl-CoA synthetase beta subunit
VEAIGQTRVDVPIVIRLVGTNEREGREILRGVSGLTAAETMDEAVQRAIELAGGTAA